MSLLNTLKFIVLNYGCLCREIRQKKEKQRIERTGRNKFNSNPKEVRFSLSL